MVRGWSGGLCRGLWVAEHVKEGASDGVLRNSTRCGEFLEAPHLAFARGGIELIGRAGLQRLDMVAQGRGRRHLEHEIDAVRPAPVDNERATTMAVAADQNVRLRPVGTGGPQEAAQMSTDFTAARPLGGSQDKGDEASVTVEHHDGPKTVVGVVSIEEPKPLAAVNGIERVVDVKHDPLRHRCERGTVKVHHCLTPLSSKQCPASARSSSTTDGAVFERPCDSRAW